LSVREGTAVQEQTTSLVDVPPGETVVVRRVLFDSLRAHCAERGIKAGDRITVVRSSESNLLLWEAGGRVVRCRPEVARFVEVASQIAPEMTDGV
jgi:hypothetical protein